jgi:hypothetical protein
MAERNDPDFAREALAAAVRLAPRDAAPRLDLARLHAEAGELERASREAKIVLDGADDEAARARAAFMLGDIARAQGDEARARGFYEIMARIEDAVLKRDPASPTAGRWYARAIGRLAELDAVQGNLARARSGAEGALALLYACATQTGEPPMVAADIADAEMRLAALLLDEDKAAEARRHLHRAIGRYEALTVTETEEPHWRAVLADAWALAAEADYLRGARAEARSAIDKALQARLKLASERREEAWALAGAWRLRAALLEAIDDNEGASLSLAQARALAERLAASAPGMEAPARFLAHTLLDQADHALRRGALETAREASEKARALAEAFAHATKAASWLGECGACWDRLGEAARLGRIGPLAQDAMARAAEFRRLALEADANDARARHALGSALLKYGEISLDLAAPQTARTAFNECASIRLQAFQAAPESLAAAHALAVALERVGLAAAAMGANAAARAAWEDELALAERMFGDDETLDAIRFRAIVEAHLFRLGGADRENHRRAALDGLDKLANAAVLTPDEAALRKQLWSN